mmetsp:Transcript_10069/g.16713  ORF Transcript_10069/g.16713 Transcript_10069/m.16713 type:complete len:101 (+) Transcript_10069:172-474(+)|eukprot:CAMPEP_0119032248 /NCGR_PEP_ID=MMETSP1176-20130426/41957_1 /TAXON_ID=265551 /ORGANISM="Synedropsis recta cf, Strain CCMP1620" /LENGTH=100 /DNA_ID=CAMNT_0006988659 /DNA_START=567 /DNA_END=869 /DNA_ORIENTATION=-
MTRFQAHHRLLDVADYYAEPEDRIADQSQGKTIFVIIVFGLLITGSVGYFVIKKFCPSVKKSKVECLEDFGDTDTAGESYSTPTFFSYEPPKADPRGTMV